MGPYVKTVHQEFLIPRDSLWPAAISLFHEVLDEEDQREFSTPLRSEYAVGSSGKIVQTIPTPSNHDRNTTWLRQCSQFHNIMKHIGWEADYSNEYDAIHLHWPRGRFFEQAENAIQTIAKYVTAGSHIAIDSSNSLADTTAFTYKFDGTKVIRHDHHQMEIAWTDLDDVQTLFRKCSQNMISLGISREDLIATIDELITQEVITS